MRACLEKVVKISKSRGGEIIIDYLEHLYEASVGLVIFRSTDQLTHNFVFGS